MPMLRPWGATTCAVCGSRFHLSAARWRDLKAPRKASERMMSGLGLGKPPPVHPSRGRPFLFGLGRCWIARNSARWLKACPRCDADLPDLVADGFQAAERIALVAGSNAGKSQMIWAIVDALVQSSSGFGGSPSFARTFDLDNFASAGSRDLWQRKFADHVEGRRPGDGSKPGGPAGVPARKVVPMNGDPTKLSTPIIVRLHLTADAGPDGRVRGSRVAPVDLLFYDTAGENFTRDSAAMRQFAGYVRTATGLIFLVDPDGCPEFNPAVSEQAARSPNLVIDTIRQALIEDHLLRQDERIPVPTAVVLTKADTLRDRFRRDNPRDPWDHPPDYSRGFPEATSRAISADIRERLRRGSQQGLLRLIETHFVTHRFFACSALGQVPDAHGFLREPAAPFRVLDPLLWHLHHRCYLRPAPLPPGLTADPADPTDTQD